MYRKVGEINGFGEIPWGKEITITGGVGRGWFWRMKGVFRKGNGDFRFVDDFGMSTRFGRDDLVSLNLLEKQDGAGDNYARKPEGSK